MMAATADDAPAFARRAASLGRVLCLTGGAIGAMGLLGLTIGVPFFTTLVPGEPEMKANTALSLCLLGLAGALRQPEAVPRVARLLAIASALVALAIGLGTTAEYATGRDLGIDRLLPEVASTPHPGRPSPPTAAAVALLAAGSLLFDHARRARARPSEWMILLAGLVAFAAIVGAAFGAGPLYRMRNAPITGVAVPTAIGLLLISAGMFLERSRAGIARLVASPGPGGVLLRRMVLPCLTIPVLLGFGLSRLFGLAGIQDVALLFATLVALSAVVGFALLAISAAPLDRVHQALAASRTEIRELVQQAPDGIFVADLDGRYTDVNRAGCDLLGYAREEIIGKTILDLIPPEDLGRLAAAREHLLAGATEVAEWQLRRKDATYVPVEVNSKILPDGRWQGFVRDITDRRRAEAERQRADEALRRSELKFRRLAETLPDGVVIHQAGRILYLNKTFATLLGYEDETELIGKAILELVSPEFHEAIRERTRFVRQTGKSAPPLEVKLVRRDGSRAIIESVGVEVELEGAPAIVVVVRDVAPRVQAEQALRFSEAKFSGIVSISADAIISVDEHQRITVFNAGAEAIFGYSPDEILGAPLDVLLPERLREQHRIQVGAFAGGQVTARRMGERHASIKGRRKSGEEFPAEASISNLRVGEVTLLTVVLRDVTERERLEREQQVLAEVGVVLAGTLDFEQTLSRVAEIAARSLADWCMVEVVEPSQALRRVRVASADPAKNEIAGGLERVNLDHELPRQPAVIPRLTRAELEAIAQGPAHLQVLRAMAPASLISVPLMVGERLMGSLTFVSSTPARVYGATDLRLATAIAQHASLAIENARLYRAALQATGMRDQVLGVVAHDLRNPLSTISLHASALGRARQQPERRDQKHKQAIERATGRMNRLIQDLLDVVVLEAGHLRVVKSELSPNDLLAEAVETQRALAAATSIELRLDAAPDVPPILGDRERLLQVFANLIGNALKFTEAGGEVTAGVTAGESSALFWVADTGRGLTPAELARVFDRFWQASARSGRLGAGLGLPITKGIVEAHGGRIWVESTPGEGSTFFFSIPLAAPRGAAAGDVVH
jgi:PAS domain S-box-containing protein